MNNFIKFNFFSLFGAVEEAQSAKLKCIWSQWKYTSTAELPIGRRFYSK